MGHNRLDPSDLYNKEYYSRLLAHIELGVRDKIIEAPGDRSRIIQELNEFGQELQQTAHSLEVNCDGGQDSQVGTAVFDMMDEYIQPGMFDDEVSRITPDLETDQISSISEHAGSYMNLSERPLSAQATEFASIFSDDAGSPMTLPGKPPSALADHTSEACMSSLGLQFESYPPLPKLHSILQPRDVGISTPTLFSGTLPIELSERSASIASTSNEICADHSVQSHLQVFKPLIQKRKVQHPKREVSSILTVMIENIGCRSSITQLKASLNALRDRPESPIRPAGSTREIWDKINRLEIENHTNGIHRRLCLVELHSRKLELFNELSSRLNKNQTRTRVIDDIANEVGEEDRTRVINRLHQAGIWANLKEEFGVGIVALIASGTSNSLSNSSVERANSTVIGEFCNPLRNRRHGAIKRFAEKVSLMMPLFEGNGCDLVFRLEKVKDEELGQIKDESELLKLLEPA